MKVPNWTWPIIKLIYGNRITTIEYHLERSYMDDDQIFNSFALQFIAQVRKDMDEMEHDLIG